MKLHTESSRIRGRALRFALAVLLLFGMSLACTLSGETPNQGKNSEDKIATSVAETLSAQESDTLPPPASNTPEIQASAIPPTETASPTSAPDILYQGISFSYADALASSITTETIPAFLSEGPGGSYPEHVRFSFVGYPLSGTFHDPRILVYPTEAYRNIYPYANDIFTNLQTLLTNQPSNPESIPFLPIFNAAQFMQAQVAYFDFQNGAGVRFLTLYGQAARVVNNEELFYTYQGMTNDGNYYISAILPISHPSLPATSPMDLDPEFYENFEAHLAEVEGQLNEKEGSSFFPTLTMLDEMMQSFSITNP